MSPRLGALVLFAADVERTVAFYRALGLDLEVEDHGDEAGPEHYAGDVDGCHFAVFQADGPARSPGFREPGATFPGLVVDSVEEAVRAGRDVGAVVVEEPSERPWGLRAVLEDPDGRPVEVYRPPV